MDKDFLRTTESDQRYIVGMKPMFFKNALFADSTDNYVIPSEPNPYGNVTFKFRTAKSNVDYVDIVIDGERVPMSLDFTDKMFDFYSCSYMLSQNPITYYFEVTVGKLICQYDAFGIVTNANPIRPFRLYPGFHTPKWAKGAVMYQIYVERFCNGDPTNDVQTGEYHYVGGPVQHIDDWYQIPAVDGTREFYGGDLQGVIDKLDYLKDLGIDCIYFNPLFVSPSNHKYDSQDYEHIDPHFGKIVKDGGECLKDWDSDNKNATKYQIRACAKENLEASDNLFKELVDKAHSLGIRVILDGVFNHCGSFNKWLDREGIYGMTGDYAKGAYEDAASPYRKFFDFRNDNWPNNGSYDGWWGFDTLPKLNYEASPELCDKIMDVAAKWVSKPYNADGWRLDVAADIGHSPEFNHEFFKRLRRTIKDMNPDALILAEHYGDPANWLNGDEWDSVMNYDGFMEPVTWFLTGMQKHSDDYRQDMQGNADAFWFMMECAHYKFTNPSLEVAMNQLSNHDHSRFLTRTNHVVGRTRSVGAAAADAGVNKAIMRLAVTIQMTWTGAPTIYYGDEAGLTGFTDPDSRRTYPWGREDKELIRFHKELIRIHKENREFITGSFKKMASEHNVIGYARFTKVDASFVVVNRDNVERTVRINAWETVPTNALGFERILVTSRDGFDTEVASVPADGSKLNVVVPPEGAVIIRTARINATDKE